MFINICSFNSNLSKVCTKHNYLLQDQHVASATSFTGRFNIYDLILDKCYFEKTTDPSDGNMLPQQMTKEDMTLIKVILSKYLVLNCISRKLPNQSILYPLNNLIYIYRLLSVEYQVHYFVMDTMLLQQVICLGMLPPTQLSSFDFEIHVMIIYHFTTILIR